MMAFNLEQVKEFNYLGIIFSVSGNDSYSKEKLRTQANKAYFPMLKAMEYQATTYLIHQ